MKTKKKEIKTDRKEEKKVGKKRNKMKTDRKEEKK